ncbi:DUF4132 domain-containing protein [Klebsiella sp. MISC125]|uniref:DUF4132 domain-containing protein n=1 Tax=Klebsiella sp. MISC125 TaxID=2755386 RepID=UPI003DA83C1D
MKTFVYQDDKSHKFWTVEQQDNELHLNWGKVGTSGQSQIKTFADATAAGKAELKLINEKTKKGYVEEAAMSVSGHVTAKPDMPALAKITPELAPAPADVILPWLADEAQIALPPEVAHETLSHRNWPGNPVLVADKLTRLHRLAYSVHQRYKKTVVFDYSACTLEWQQTIAQATTLLDSPITTALPPQVLAVLVALETHFNNKDMLELPDQIVQEGGLEYATDVLIALQSIQFEWNYVANTVIFFPAHDASEDRQTYAGIEIRLRKHLSLAKEDVWQRCADKLIAALATMPSCRQPLVAVLLPEKPEIAHCIAERLCEQKGLDALEWLKLTATDTRMLEKLEKYQQLQLLDDSYQGKIRCATVLQEQGIAGLARFAPYAHGDNCGEVLIHINHPQALMLLICASERGKRGHERMMKAGKRFPHAMLAALAELLAQKEEKRWRMMLMTQLNTHPELVETVLPWLSSPVTTVLEACRRQLSQRADCANADMLPAILVSPPWMTKKLKQSIPELSLATLPLESIDNLTEDLRQEWLSPDLYGNKDAHEARSANPERIVNLLGFNIQRRPRPLPSKAIEAYLHNDYPTLKAEFKKFYTGSLDQPYWQLHILPGLPEETALSLWNALAHEPHLGEKQVMAHFSINAIHGLTASLSRYTQNMGLALYFGGTPLAPQIAHIFCNSKTCRTEAREWLLKYPEHAITGLQPAALGKAGEAQDNARLALRLLVDHGHRPLLEEVARRYNQPEVPEAVNALLSLDPLDNHPAKIPALPAFYQPALWTRPQLANGKALPDDALNHLGAMLRFPQEEGLYPGLLQVKAACTPDSLATFAWDLFEAWQAAGAPPKEGWAFSALGVLGNDDTARALTPLIRAWPGESQHKRATVGLDILAAIGTDIALMQLNGIAQKLKFKALQERARAKITDIAESRELTVAELEDRLTPDLGLDDNGTLTLDFGPRRFTVSFDEALKPFVRDENGSRLKDLPKPNKSDDETLAAAAVNRYKSLKKDARTVAAQQIMRLESAMCLRRRWTPEQFRLFLVQHPLVRHITRRLVWGVYSEENTLLTCFRVAEDNSYSDAQDNPFRLPEGQIGIPHVLEISPQDAAAFGQLFADYELLPPFRQLDRNGYHLTADEQNAVDLTRWAGRGCPSGRVAGLANKGWLRGAPQDGGWIGWMLKPLGQWTLVLEIEDGFSVDMAPDEFSAEQKLTGVWLSQKDAHNYGWGRNGPQKTPFSVLAPISISELISDIESLFD